MGNDARVGGADGAGRAGRRREGAGADGGGQPMADTAMELTFEQVTKLYGPVIGVNNISLRIGRGLTGLLGANGAGKSTLINLAAGQLRPTSGRIGVGPHDAWSSRARWHIGYSPDLNMLYEEMSGREFVVTMARLYGFGRGEARRRTEAVLEQVGMSERADRRLAGYSHGMRQRIKLAQALVHDPGVLLLDEPLNGIDPGGRRHLHELLHELSGSGKTILVSSHLLTEVEQLVDSVVVMSRGRVVASGTIAQLRELLEDHPLTVELWADEPRRLAGLLAEAPEVRSLEFLGDALRVRTQSPPRFFARVAELVTSQGVNIRQMEALDAGADAVFSYLHEGAP